MYFYLQFAEFFTSRGLGGKVLSPHLVKEMLLPGMYTNTIQLKARQNHKCLEHSHALLIYLLLALAVHHLES